MDEKLRVAIGTLADVLSSTWDARELWRAMQWTEAAAVSDVLHAGGRRDAAMDVVERWVDAAEPSTDEFAEIVTWLADRMRGSDQRLATGCQP
ncbi:hypothetical protein [Microbacterium sp. SD291]|uniref:hypothetical protein n=1 Tax=Microbacterium sp. SD291 TaxID=2782007 RepID=UPI001A962557|nr:hypothetical protein [Microbacterium sp. SD291]MBO0981963.1 hypothetical protein [Microbacterium sp. SD291]